MKPVKKKHPRGRAKASGVKSSIDPQREEFTELRARLAHGYRRDEWPIARLQALIPAIVADEKQSVTGMLRAEIKACGDKKKRKSLAKAVEEIERNEWKLPDNYLSARTHISPNDELASLWRTHRSEHERAVLTSDADWFEKQAKAIRCPNKQETSDLARNLFRAAIVRELEMAFWRKRAATVNRDGAHVESATLQPAKKNVAISAREILDRLEQRKGGRFLFVEGCRFDSARRAREAVKRISRYLGYELLD